MPKFRITDPETGKTLELTGDSQPTEEELVEIFKQIENRNSGNGCVKLKEAENTPEPQTEKLGQSGPLAEKREEGEEATETLPDVLLDVPTLEADETKLKVEGLTARVSLSAQLANMVRIDVGAYADIEKLDLDIKGLKARAILKVRLKQINSIFTRALQTLDKHPEMLRIISRNGIAEGNTNRMEAPLKQVNVEKGLTEDSNQSESRDIDQSIKSRYDETEGERRRYERNDKS